MSEEFLTGPTSTVRRRRKKKKTKSTTSTATTTNTNTEVDEAVAIAASSTGGVESVLSKLRDSVSDGDLYTSLQVYKALFARFAKQGDVEPATELAAKGSCLLLRRGLTRAATDLAFQLVDLFTESHTEASETNTVHLLNIVRAYPSHPTAPAVNGTIDDTCDEDSQRFLNGAIKWSMTEGTYPRGDPRLNYEAACAYRRSGDASNACLRYMFSEQCAEYAAYVHELATNGYRGEIDIFLARSVLQLLAVENVRDASQVYDAFIQQCGGRKALDTPLTNCVELLLELVQKGKAGLPLFQLLQKRYSKSLNRDETLQSCMGRIGHKFFGVAKPKQGGIMGMLEGLMGGPKKR